MKSVGLLTEGGRGNRGLLPPFPPVGRADVDVFGGFRLDPAGKAAPAGEDERVGALGVDDGELQIQVVWRAADAPPFRRQMIRQHSCGFETC